jgi:heme-degrading monooxygenase HmoA
MLARVTTIHVPPEDVDDEMLAFRERIFRLAQTMPGFRGGYDLSDRASGKSIAVTLWDSEAAMRASERAARPASEDADGRRGPTVETFDAVFYEPRGEDVE